MTSYRISEVAQRTGFSPATLRYYEEVGVLPTAGRSEAGYRLYDERAIERLGFVTRVKRLGLTLDEIGDLAQLWDSEACPTVQRRLADALGRRLDGTRDRQAELGSLAARLQEALDRMGDAPDAEHCDPGCPCTAGAEIGAPAACCTLDAAEVPARREAWRDLAARAVSRTVVPGGVRLVLTGGPGVAAEVAALAEAEQACCAFLSFTLGVAGGRVTLEVRAPEGVDVADVLGDLGSAAVGDGR